MPLFPMSTQPPTQYFSAVPDPSASPSTTSSKRYTLAYTTHGDPSNAAHHAVLLPSCYGGKIATATPFLYQRSPLIDDEDPVFDTEKCFVIAVGLLGGGESSSPSLGFDPQRQKEDTNGAATGPAKEELGTGTAFPETSYEDNIRLQYQLCRKLGVEKLWAYVGFSMGGQQAYHMSVLYPSFVQHMVCLAGSARTSWHNWCFLEGPRSALVASVDYEDGNYRTPVRKGTSAFGRVYSTWALSQEWFRQESWKVAGFETLQEYLDTNWSGEAGLGGWDANDLLCLLKTWQMGNVCNLNEEDGNDLKKTLGRIEARCLVMPSRTDTYFPPEDNQEEIKHLKDGKLVVIESIWGHLAGGGGGGGTKEDNKTINNTIRDWIAAPTA